jgi:1-acyl-sn-glycerol-3-phosphate acyltransferase
VGLIGTDDVQPIDSRWPKLGQSIAVRFGEPIDPARYRGHGDERLALRELTDEVMYEIRELSGYEYVDTYATKTPEDIPIRTAHIASFDEARVPDSAAS